jgi:hypothetical protein
VVIFLNISNDSLAQRLVDALPSRSYLVMSDGTNTNQAAVHSMEVYADSGGIPYRLRNPEALAAFFDGLELVEPGLVAREDWRPDFAPMPAAIGGGARPLRGGPQALDGHRSRRRTRCQGSVASRTTPAVRAVAVQQSTSGSAPRPIQRVGGLRRGPRRRSAEERADGGGEGRRVLDPREVRGSGLNDDGRVVEQPCRLGHRGGCHHRVQVPRV